MTPKAPACAQQAGPGTIPPGALLALAAWCEQRRGHGDDPCLPTNPSPRPPPPSVACPRPPHRKLGPAPPRGAAAAPPPARRQRPQRLLAELMTRSVTTQTASPGEGRHDPLPA